MHVSGLQFENYRNLVNNYIEPCGKVNIIYGDNAQGKTNLLELLWLFTGNSSFRGSKDNELIAFGKNHAKIQAKFFSEQREQTAEIQYISNGTVKKEIKINDVSKNTAAYLMEKLKAVIFSPEHLSLVKDGPSQRRKFIDHAVCSMKLKNAADIAKYNKTLHQRNALLKDIYKHKELKETLPIWDDALCSLGSMIIRQRMKYIKKLNVYAKQYHRGISSGKEELEISYTSAADIQMEDTTGEIEEKLRYAVKKSRYNDYSAGVTTVGPHRDDIEIIINGVKAKAFGSQGQQRSAVLSMKLAEAEILEKKIQEKPVILLDDVLSELDGNRQDFLLNHIKGYQVFITCCEKLEKQQAEQAKLFYVADGTIQCKG